MTKLDELISKVDGGITININEFKDHFMALDDFLLDDDHAEADCIDEMKKANTCVHLQYYPFQNVYGVTLDEVVQKALDKINAG